MIQWKLGCRSRKQKRKNQPLAKPGIEHCHWFILPLLIATPTMQFSLDRKQRRHKQNQCSASDSVGLIFARSYRSTLLITTPTTTPSLVKTSLKYCLYRSMQWKSTISIERIVISSYSNTLQMDCQIELTIPTLLIHLHWNRTRSFCSAGTIR